MSKIETDPFGWKSKSGDVGLNYGDPKLAAMAAFIGSGDFGKIEYSRTKNVEAEFAAAIGYDPGDYDAEKVLAGLRSVADENDRRFFSKPYADNVVLVLEKAFGVPDAAAIGYAYCESDAGNGNLSFSVQGNKMPCFVDGNETNDDARMPFSFLGYKGVDGNWHIYIPKFENNFDSGDIEKIGGRSKSKTQFMGIDIEMDNQFEYLKKWMQKRIYGSERRIFDRLTAADSAILPLTNYGHIERGPTKKLSDGTYSAGRFVFDGKLSRLMTSGTSLSGCHDADFRIKMPEGFAEALPDDSAFDLLSMIDYNKNAKIIHSQFYQDSESILIKL